MLPFSQSHTPLLTSLFASVLLLVGCGGDTGSGAEGGNSEAPALSGTVRLDGSSWYFRSARPSPRNSRSSTRASA